MFSVFCACSNTQNMFEHPKRVLYFEHPKHVRTSRTCSRAPGGSAASARSDVVPLPARRYPWTPCRFDVSASISVHIFLYKQ